MKRFVAATTLAAAFCAAALADPPPPPYFVRGEFNGWTNSTDPMIDMGGGMWSYTVTGLTPGQGYEFKATVDDWSFNAPGSNARYVGDGFGELRVNFFPNDVWADGWEPSNKPRLGWEDADLFDWELAGEMNGWSGGPAWYLNDMGNGLHRGDFFLAAGTYQFKFRKQGDWGFSIGDDFGNAAANNSITLGADSLVRFEIDLPGGRWRAFVVPEPASLLLIGLGGVLALRRR